MSLEVPYWGELYKDGLTTVKKYEQDRLEGFLIVSLDRDEYEQLQLARPLEKAIDLDDKEVYYIYDQKEYDKSVERVIDFLKKNNKEELLAEIKEKYNPNKGVLTSKKKSTEEDLEIEKEKLKEDKKKPRRRKLK